MQRISDPAKRGTYLASLDRPETNLPLALETLPVGVAANPAANNEGYLVFARQEALMAQYFDFSRNQLMGEPLCLAERVKFTTRGDRYITDVQASLSAKGALVMIEGYTSQQLAWFDRAGKKLGTVGPPGSMPSRLSPNDQRLAVVRSEPGLRNSDDIYLFDLEGGTDQRFTSDPGRDDFPVWSPDGSRIVWTSYREVVGNLYWKAASGAGPDELLLRSPFRKRASDWSTDGRFILYSETNPQTEQDLWALPMEGERIPWLWLRTPYTEIWGRFSPDGKWIAYQSNESGRPEIYLRAFAPGAPASGVSWKLSTNGGSTPHWRREGGELYYISADDKLMVVETPLDAEAPYKTPKELFALSDRGENISAPYDYMRDGKRFLFVTFTEENSVAPFTVAQNWMTEVKK